MADPRGESNSYGGYSGSGGGGYSNKSGGKAPNQNNTSNNAAAERAAAAAAKEAQRRNADMQAQIKAAEARKQMDEANARYEAQQAQAAMAAARRPQEQNTRAAAPTVFQRSSPAVPSMNPNQVNQPYYSPYQDQPTMFQNSGLPFGGMAGRFGEALGQDNYFGGLLSAYGQINPLGSIANQTTYGMNQDVSNSYLKEEQSNPNWDRMSEAQRVQAAKDAVYGSKESQIPRPSNFRPEQWAQMTQGQKQYMSGVATPTNGVQDMGGSGGAFAGQAGMGNAGGGGGNMMNSFLGGQLPELNMGMGRDYQPTGGTFKPITFRSGTGNPDPYAGLSDMAQQGQGMFNVAGQDALQAADQFNYNFDPQQAGLDLFNERSSLLEPAFAQQRAKNLEQMQGLGRIGLQLSGEGLGAGENSGMMNPDMFGMNAAQSQALAGLAAQSTQDAFGQEVQRAGLDLSQFNTNQVTDQQRYANLMGTGQSMLTGSMLEPQVRAQLLAQQQTQQGLDQSYEIDRYNADTSRLTGQAQANQANYQPDPWLSAGIGLGTSFLGTEAGGGWLSGVGGDIWDFFT